MNENEKKKEYLNEYYLLVRKLQSLQEQKHSILELKQYAGVQNLSDMPKGHKKWDLSDYIIKLEHIEEEIKKQELLCYKKKLEIEEHVLHIKNGIESDIIRKRYLEQKSWEDICLDIGYSWRQTHRIHAQALKHLQIEDDMEWHT